MEINLKIKFDKHHKTNTWDRPELPYFFDHPPPPARPKLSPCSMRQDIKHSHQHRDSDPPPPPSARKSSTARKSSKSKISTKPPSRPKIQTKTATLQKNSSDKLRKGRKKGNTVEDSSLQEVEGLKKSLPGLSGKKVIQKYQQVLSQHQRIELINEKTVYYVGLGTGMGEDDLEGRYMWQKHEQVGYRYQMLEGLGRGAFGQVVRAFDHKSGEEVAVKIVRAGREQMQLALNEINILMSIKQKDIENRRNILRIKDFLVFRRHICIITEVLGASLYHLLEANLFRPLDAHNVRAFAIQLLFSLAFLKQLEVVHSDIKPQNILMKQKGKVGIKLVDFGTSMFTHQTTFTYIQSRFYRAPEVILGAKYGTPIDMWSFGCLIAELSMGNPLFAGENEQQQLSLIIRSLGVPSHEYMASCKNSNKFFSKDFTPKIIKGKDGKALIPGSRPLSSLFSDLQLCNFLEKVLKVEPGHRLTPLQALAQPWILEYFPQNMRKQHLNDILLKIKKEEGGHEKEVKSSTTGKGHRKRNSELHGGVGISHRRRGSDGAF